MSLDDVEPGLPGGRRSVTSPHRLVPPSPPGAAAVSLRVNGVEGHDFLLSARVRAPVFDGWQSPAYL